MREGSALLERLEKRFDAIDSRADRRSVGMRQRDSFLSHFSDRMKELQNLVQIPEMSAFRRLPKVGKSFDPWGNMGGWSVLQDLVYLEWLEEQEIEDEEIEQPRVSAWGTATSSAQPRRNSAWLNTPYTPARVAGKPLPKPQMRGEQSQKRLGSSSRPKRNRTTKRPRNPQAPTLTVSPLKRAMGRATVAQERISPKSRVMNSLPPMLAQTAGKRWVESAQKQSNEGLRQTAGKSSSLRSPILKMVDREMEVGSADASLSQSRLASQRLKTPSRTNLLSSNDSVGSVNRGLRTSIPSILKEATVPSGAKITASQTGMDVNLTTTVRQEVIRAVQVAVPAQVSKTVKRLSKNASVASAEVGKSSKQIAEVIERLVLNEAQTQVESIFQSASISSLEQLTQSTGTKQGAIRRVKTIVTDVVKQIVKQAEQSGVIERAVLQEDSTDLKQSGIKTLTTTQRQVVIQRLQAKGVRRQLAERILESVAPTSQDVQFSISEVMSRVLEVVDNPESEVASFSKRALTKQVRRQLKPLLEQSKVKTVLSKSLLPSVAGENLSDRIIADVVNEIAAYADRETLVENSEGQRQLMNSLERTVSKLVTKTRKPQISLDADWVDVQAFGQSTIEEDVEQEGASSISPWFTRETNLDATESKQARSSLQPMQQAAARVLKMVSENPTRPEVIARQTGLKVQEVQQIVSAVQGFKPSIQQEKSPMESAKIVSDSGSLASSSKSGRAAKQLQSETSSTLDSLATRIHRSSKAETTKEHSHPLEKLWNRATSPIELPEWKGMGTSSFKPTIGESAKGWRLSPKRRPVHPYSVDVESTVLQQASTDMEMESEFGSTENTPSPWLSRKNTDMGGFGFVPQTISGDAKLSSNEIAMFGGQAKSVQLSVGDVKNQQARWLEPNRTVVLDNGTVIHAKVAKRLGLEVKSASKQNLPLSWTLEGLQLKSDHQSLPTWAKRASGKPQVKASPEFLVALAKASSAEDVAEVILQNSGRSNEGVLPKTAMTAIDQIRREAHRSLRGMESLQQEMQQEMVNPSRTGRDRTRRRVSRTARAVADGLTGLKPISMATPASSSEAAGTDKVSKLAKQLESLVSMAESNRRDEAREGVRMAEESHDAIAEGQAASKSEERDYAVDIEALRQEVMRAFEQEMSLRNLRSFEGSNNTDPWW